MKIVRTMQTRQLYASYQMAVREFGGNRLGLNTSEGWGPCVDLAPVIVSVPTLTQAYDKSPSPFHRPLGGEQATCLWWGPGEREMILYVPLVPLRSSVRGRCGHCCRSTDSVPWSVTPSSCSVSTTSSLTLWILQPFLKIIPIFRGKIQKETHALFLLVTSYVSRKFFLQDTDRSCEETDRWS